MAKRRRRSSKDASGFKIEIPDEAEQQETVIGDAVMAVYGPAKIGKTALASYFPDSIFVLTEPGGKFVKVRPVKVNGKKVISSWAQFQAAVPVLQKTKARTIVIDVVDALYQMCFDAVCSDLNIDHPNDLGHGKGWNRIGLEWNEWMTRLCNLGKGVIFVSHVNERTYSSPVEEKTKVSLSLPKTGYTIINALCDFTFFYHYKTLKVKTKEGRKRSKSVRVLYCNPTDDIDAGDRTGLFPPYIKMPAGRAAYEALEATFDSVQKEMRAIVKRGD